MHDNNIQPGLIRLFRAGLLSCLVSPCLSLAAADLAQPSGLAFSHHDWELACDHTRTCRAASPALREPLHSTLKGRDDVYCDDFLQAEAKDTPLSFTRLTDTQLLVSAQCWSGAYNIGQGHWVVNDTPPFHPVLVTTSGSEQSGGSISASHKGRGIGDCWSLDEWTWDGRRFVHTASSTTSMCKLVAAGGAWQLPTIVTTVRQPPADPAH